ncbi:hypothetical protein LHGZ1_1552 [Laribacter hongkongensis]|uniref:Uncharacterized protein n=1 Tax=Laribacter hongkongensis TaxID=168471 RepID=A0A248LJM9_9NEIS|nr:hypothetical protein LHGZ1_1552 [Laribacter hongkongensis]
MVLLPVFCCFFETSTGPQAVSGVWRNDRMGNSGGGCHACMVFPALLSYVSVSVGYGGYLEVMYRIPDDHLSKNC